MSDASISSGTFSGRGATADSISAGGPPEKDGGRQALAALLGNRIVIAAPLADLPVHAGGARVVHLHAVHPEVMTWTIGMRGVDQRESDERPAVFRPARDHGQLVETGRRR